MGKHADDEAGPRITDHALLRYLERVMGFDIEGLRLSLMTPAVELACRTGAKRVLHDGFEFIIEGGVVVTIVRRASRNDRGGSASRVEREKAGLINADNDDWQPNTRQIEAGE
jgi:hypothetical protein